MKYVPLIPCYNPNEKLLDIISELVKTGFKDIIVVDDGSNDKKIFNIVKKNKNCILITHDKNKGKGMALKSGINYYLDKLINKYEGIVSIDCDGQHLVSDMILVGNKMISSNNFTLGVRMFDGKNVPIRNRLGNKITSFVFKILFKKHIKDTQTGLRGFPNRLLKLIKNCDGERYEYEINMLIDMVINKEEIEEVKIETIYNKEKNKYSYFKPFKDSYDIYKVMFRRVKR